MNIFYAIVHKDPDSSFGVSFPDLPGCFSAADEQSDLVANAMEALQLYAEDQELPKPSGIDRIREAAAADLAQGAFILPVPFIENTQRTKRVNVILNQGLLNAIDTVAGQRGMTRSAFLEDVATREIRGVRIGREGRHRFGGVAAKRQREAAAGEFSAKAAKPDRMTFMEVDPIGSTEKPARHGKRQRDSSEGRLTRQGGKSARRK